MNSIETRDRISNRHSRRNGRQFYLLPFALVALVALVPDPAGPDESGTAHRSTASPAGPAGSPPAGPMPLPDARPSRGQLRWRIDRYSKSIASRIAAMRRAPRGLPCLLVALVFMGCHREDAVNFVRLIPEEPARLFTPDALDPQLIAAFDWRFDASSDFDPWICEEVDETCEVTQGALVITSTSNDPKLILPTRFLARDVSIFEVVASDSERMEIFWTRRGEAFSPERGAILAPTAARTASGRRVFRTVLDGHPGWSGEIVKIRLDPTQIPHRRIEITAVRALRRELGPSSLEEVDGTGWKAVVGADVRNAWIAPPGSTIAREVEVPANGELRFGFGSVRGLTIVRPFSDAAAAGEDRQAPRFQVSAALQGEEPTVLLDSIRDPRIEGYAWSDVALGLDRYRGKKIRLQFSVDPLPSGSWMEGLPVWANPTVVRAGREGARPNVILISIDTLRADHLSLNGYHRETSPNIDAWAARRGVNFRNTIAPAPFTLASHTSLFSGLSPLRHQTHFVSTVPAETVLLAELLRESGYATTAITGGVVLQPSLGLNQGFDRYVYWPSQSPAGDRELQSNLLLALEHIEQSPVEPFFLFFHTYEVHYPYRDRAPFQRRFGAFRWRNPEAQLHPRAVAAGIENGFTDSFRFFFRRDLAKPMRPLPDHLLPEVVALYDSGIAYADLEIGKLLDEIEASGLADRTIVVLTSDHGESLGEQGRATHYHLHEENLKVPLVVALPGVEPHARTIESQVRLIDIAPTILQTLGLDHAQTMDGVSLAPLIEGGEPPAATRRAWSYVPNTNWGLSLRVDNRLKYMFFDSPWTSARGVERLYDLSADPEELVDLAPGKPEETRALRRTVEEALARAAGLHLRFESATGTLSGTVTAPFQASALRSLTPEEPCVEWLGNTIAFEVTSGDCVVTIASPVAEDLRFEGLWRSPDGDLVPLTWVLATPDPGSTVYLGLSDGDWVEGSDAATPAIGITAHQAGSAADSAALDDPRLVEELRALGYLR